MAVAVLRIDEREARVVPHARSISALSVRGEGGRVKMARRRKYLQGRIRETSTSEHVRAKFASVGRCAASDDGGSSLSALTSVHLWPVAAAVSRGLRSQRASDVQGRSPHSRSQGLVPWSRSMVVVSGTDSPRRVRVTMPLGHPTANSRRRRSSVFRSSEPERRVDSSHTAPHRRVERSRGRYDGALTPVQAARDHSPATNCRRRRQQEICRVNSEASGQRREKQDA